MVILVVASHQMIMEMEDTLQEVLGEVVLDGQVAQEVQAILGDQVVLLGTMKKQGGPTGVPQVTQLGGMIPQLLSSLNWYPRLKP